MGKIFPALLPEHEAFIKRQHIFFVGSAPLSEDGHINISPKGYDTLRVISPTKVAYLDVTGSGNETSAHLAENRRITFMFVAFEGAPVILRLYGRGQVILRDSPEWDEQVDHFDLLPGARQIIAVDIQEVKTSCGMSIPFFTYSGERDALQQWAAKMGDQDLGEYRRQKNSTSMDRIVTPLGQTWIDLG